MLSDRLMGKTYSTAGIAVSPEEVEMLVFGDNPHPIVQAALHRSSDRHVQQIFSCKLPEGYRD